MYRHALPPGFQLKSDRKKQDEESEKISIETLVETERAALGANVTKVTLESFLAWKKRKIEEKKSKAIEKDEKKKRDFKLGFVNGLTGRDLFTFNPDLITNDDEGAGDDIDYKQREDHDESVEDGSETKQTAVQELDLNYLLSQAQEVDGTGTIATADRFDYIKTILNKPKSKHVRKIIRLVTLIFMSTLLEMEEENKLDMACGGVDNDVKVVDVDEDDDNSKNDDGSNDDEENNENENNSQDKTSKTDKNNLEIDESLFTLDDLGNIQDELENLDI